MSSKNELNEPVAGLPGLHRSHFHHWLSEFGFGTSHCCSELKSSGQGLFIKNCAKGRDQKSHHEINWLVGFWKRFVVAHPYTPMAHIYYDFTIYLIKGVSAHTEGARCMTANGVDMPFLLLHKGLLGFRGPCILDLSQMGAGTPPVGL